MSLKAILRTYRLVKRRDKSQDRGQNVVRNDDRAPINSSKHRASDTSLSNLTTNKEGLTNRLDATTQPYLNTLRMQNPYTRSLSSPYPQSEDVFTPDLSISAYQELTLICAGFIIQNSSPSLGSSLSQYGGGNHGGPQAMETIYTTFSLAMDQHFCADCSALAFATRHEPHHRSSSSSRMCVGCKNGIVRDTVRDKLQNMDIGLDDCTPTR